MKGIYLSLALYGLTLHLMSVELVHSIFLALGAIAMFGFFVCVGWCLQVRLEEWWWDAKDK